MGTLNPGFGWEKARRSLHGEQDVLQGVPSGRCRALPGDRGRHDPQIAGDLGITEATLSAWIKAAGVAIRGRHGAAVQVDDGDELARLRARVSELEATERTLATERDILRAAAKSFAGQTTW